MTHDDLMQDVLWIPVVDVKKYEVTISLCD